MFYTIGDRVHGYRGGATGGSRSVETVTTDKRVRGTPNKNHLVTTRVRLEMCGKKTQKPNESGRKKTLFFPPRTDCRRQRVLNTGYTHTHTKP